ncbi:hypothetical protein FACS1894105_00380 [Clostridia bacterium]|nr:hypothetical protein FACS1894105_00380 [Clostridia bacterium]
MTKQELEGKYANLIQAQQATPMREIIGNIKSNVDIFDIFDFFMYQVPSSSALVGDYKINKINKNKKDELLNKLIVSAFKDKSKCLLFTDNDIDVKKIEALNLADNNITFNEVKGYINKTSHGLNSLFSLVRNSLAHGRVSIHNNEKQFIFLENITEKSYESINGKKGNISVVTLRLILTLENLCALKDTYKQFVDKANKKEEKERKEKKEEEKNKAKEKKDNKTKTKKQRPKKKS